MRTTHFTDEFFQQSSQLPDFRLLQKGSASLGTLGYAEKIYARARSLYVQLSAEF